MTTKARSRPELKQRRPGFYSRIELAIWLGVSRNSVEKIAKRFQLIAIEGLYPEADVWRKILSINPRHQGDRELLRKVLENSGWLSSQIGMPSSTVRAKIARGTFEYPSGVQLADTRCDGGLPRSRRWIPCIIRALADGRQQPEFEYIVHSNSSGVVGKTDAEKPIIAPVNNVFARIVNHNDEAAQQ